MNIIITLPHYLWAHICIGTKKIELRKKIPLNFQTNESKCFVVLKGTHRIIGWFTISQFTKMPTPKPCTPDFAKALCVPRNWVDEYLKKSDYCYCWHIKDVYAYKQRVDIKENFEIHSNPQSYVYTDKDPTVPYHPWRRR